MRPADEGNSRVLALFLHVPLGQTRQFIGNRLPSSMPFLPSYITLFFIDGIAPRFLGARYAYWSTRHPLLRTKQRD